MALVFHEGFEVSDGKDWDRRPNLLNRLRCWWRCSRWMAWWYARKEEKKAIEQGRDVCKLKKGMWYRYDYERKRYKLIGKAEPFPC